MNIMKTKPAVVESCQLNLYATTYCDSRIRASASKKMRMKKVFWVIPVAVCLFLPKEIN